MLRLSKPFVTSFPRSQFELLSVFYSHGGIKCIQIEAVKISMTPPICRRLHPPIPGSHLPTSACSGQPEERGEPRLACSSGGHPQGHWCSVGGGLTSACCTGKVFSSSNRPMRQHCPSFLHRSLMHTSHARTLINVCLQLEKGLEDPSRRLAAAETIHYYCSNPRHDFQEHVPGLLTVTPLHFRFSNRECQLPACP